MKKPLIFIALLLVVGVVAPVAAYVVFFQARTDVAQTTIDYEDVLWDELVPEDAFNFLQDYVDATDVWNDEEFLDLVEAADRLTVAAMHGQSVRIPGFMVPMELDANRVRDFMLVPIPGACIHVPPPPPNQTILAAAERPVKLHGLFEPVWIEGQLFVETATNDLAETSYRLEVASVEVYDDPDAPLHPGY